MTIAEPSGACQRLELLAASYEQCHPEQHKPIYLRSLADPAHAFENGGLQHLWHRFVDWARGRNTYNDTTNGAAILRLVRSLTPADAACIQRDGAAERIRNMLAAVQPSALATWRQRIQVPPPPPAAPTPPPASTPPSPTASVVFFGSDVEGLQLHRRMRALHGSRPPALIPLQPPLSVAINSRTITQRLQLVNENRSAPPRAVLARVASGAGRVAGWGVAAVRYGGPIAAGGMLVMAAIAANQGYSDDAAEFANIGIGYLRDVAIAYGGQRAFQWWRGGGNQQLLQLWQGDLADEEDDLQPMAG